MENVIALQNPWKRGRKALTQSIIERKVVPKINSWMAEEELIVIKGARQAGKTTILYCLIDQLLQKGVSPNHIFYFLLDNLTLRQYFSKDPYALKTTLDQFIGQPLENYDQRIYIFLDEIQKLPGFSEVVKEYFDLFKNLKFIISGSSILQLSSTISESLRGRTVSFTVTPFSLGEVLPEIKTIPFEELLDGRKLKEHFTRLLPFKSEITLQLNKQLVFGSMPRIVLSHTNDQRQIRLGEYLETFIHKDIIETLQVAKYLDFEKMLKLISFQIGKTVNISELGSHTQLSNETVRKYLMLGEEAFLFEFLPPFFSSKRKSLVKDRKIYFEDLGIRNHLSGNDTLDLLNKPNLGAEVENFVNATLNKLMAVEKLKMAKFFFRSYGGQEVDFVLEFNHQLIPIEVKFQTQLKKRDFSHLLLFMDDLNLTRGLMITKDTFDTQTFGEREILLVPLWLFGMVV